MGMLLFFLLPPISLVPTASSSDLIQETCKGTKYYNLCISSLIYDTTSPKADTRGPALIMARLGVTNATATTFYISSELVQNAKIKNDDAMKKAI